METELKSVTLEKCVDGDTASFKLDGEVKKFRFLAIDTPESVHPTKKEEAYGKTASEYTCEILTNASELYVEIESKNQTDKYGRSLAWVWVDNELLQKKLIENGYAQVAYIYGNYKYTLSLCAIQADAKKEKINIWSDKKYEEGYCATVDTTGVSKDIQLDKEVATASSQSSMPSWLYYVIAALLLIIIFTNKSLRTKAVKKAKTSIEKEISKTLSKK